MKSYNLLYIFIAFLFANTSFSQTNNKLKENVAFQKTLKFNEETDNNLAVDLFKKEFNLGKENSFVQKTATTDNIGITHKRQQQYYKGLKVEFGTLITHSQNEVVKSVNGELYNAAELNLIPTLSKSEGFNIAIEDTQATKFLWENIADADAMYYKKPEGELVIFPMVKSGTMKLAYKYDVYSTEPIARIEIYVDAHSGEILYKNPIIKHANGFTANKKNIKKSTTEFTNYITGTAATRYSGSRQIETTLVGTDHVLNDLTRGGGIFTYNSERTVSYPSTNFTDVDNNWTAAEFANTFKDNAALDAHWGAEITYDFWKVLFNRNSFDNLGSPIKSYVHYRSVETESLFNAFWNGSVMSYGDGSGTTGSPLTSIDICGHEIGHAICTYTANLAYQNQSGGINEGYSDIWGACIEQYGRTGSLGGAIAPAIWSVGEDIAPGGLRSMSNPELYRDPSTYLGTNWKPTADESTCVPSRTLNDYCGVHSNSGVLNKWFYILTAGASGTNNAPVPDTYNVTGIGMQKAAEIAYLVERDYLTPNSTYLDARNASIEVVTNLYCPIGPEAIAVTNAWFAVNVGEQFFTNTIDVALKSVSKSINVSCTGSAISPSIIFANSGSQPITSTTITYNIDGGANSVLTDNEVLQVCGTKNIVIPISGLSLGNHVLKVTISTLNDVNVNNNTKSSIILVNGSTTNNTINTFDNITDNLNSVEEGGATNSVWERGSASRKIILKSTNIVYATKLRGLYPNKSKSYLFSRCYDLTTLSNPKVEFDMAFELEQDYDLLYVQTSTDGGTSWSNLGTGVVNNWYNSNKMPNSVDCQNCIGGQWTGTDAIIKHYSYNLQSNNNTIIRFVMHSDDEAQKEGVIIDNFQVSGGILATSKNEFNVFNIFPNPSNGLVSISLSTTNDVKVQLNDISGRIIYNETFKNADLTFKKDINFNSLTKGIYLINVESDGKTASRKLIIE